MIFKLLKIEEQTQSSNVPYPQLCCLKNGRLSVVIWFAKQSYIVQPTAIKVSHQETIIEYI